MSDDDPFLREPPRDFGRGRGRDQGGPRRVEARVPPHNLSAEESLLGALLLSREVVGQVAELGVLVEHFYKPGHQHIYAAIRGLMAQGQPVDIVTVADELRRNGLLEEVGGPAALLDLQNATPAISNAARYAKIVQDTAVLRKLISVAGEITEMAYTEPDDVTKALDEAETKVFEVAEDRVVDSTRPLGDLLPLAMDKLQETFERGDTITGTATGYDDLDEILSGLQPSTLNIVGARPAMGKCVAWDTPVMDPTTGAVRTAAEWFDEACAGRPIHVLSLDGDGRTGPRTASAAIDNGRKPVFAVTTRSGRRLRITASHPLLSQRGWQPLGELAVGDDIAVPTALPVFGTAALPDADIDLLALACGSEHAHDKRVPAAVFTAPRHQVVRFLNRLFATDGTAWVATAGYARIGYASVSRGIAADVAHLLLRFGIRSKLRTRSIAYAGGRRTSYEVEVMDASSLLRFAEEIGILGKEAAVERVAERARASASGGFTVDSLPMDVWDDVMKAKGDRSWAAINTQAGKPRSHNWHPYRRRPRRETIALLADVLDDDRLRWWASPDIGWDRIVAIEPDGLDRVIDLTVPEVHNFVAADVYVHNTALGLGMATHIAKKTHKPVLVFSLEMGHAELTQRILSGEAEVDSSKLRTGRLAESDWTKIGKAINRIDTIPLYLDDNPRVTVMEIRAKARRLKARHGGLGMILIDYLQLMSGGATAENRQLEVSEISRGLKILARELEVPIVALSQLSRNLESRADKRPMLADLRESGSLEQDADVVMFLYRDEVYNRDSPDKAAAELIVAKHRSGPTGVARLVFRGQYTKFGNAARNV